MPDAIKRFVLALSIGIALLAGVNVVKRYVPVSIGESNISKGVSTATTEYRHALADIADKYAGAPKATVSETMEAIRVEGEEARTEFRKKLSAVMEPELGSTELKPETAKRVLSEVAKGFRK